MNFKNPWGTGSNQFDKWFGNIWNPSNSQYHNALDTTTEQYKVKGPNSKEVVITNNQDGTYTISGAEGDSLRVLQTMVLTPQSAKEAIRLTTIKDEVRFLITNEIITVMIGATPTEAHGITQAFDKYDTEIKEGDSFEDFSYWKITISLANTTKVDRMTSWSDEEKLCIIGAHEAGHIGRLGYNDTDHSQMVAYGNELITRFEYSELFPNKSAERSTWLPNYNKAPEFGVDTVNKYYRTSINELVDAGKLTKAEGKTKKTEFEQTNTGQ